MAQPRIYAGLEIGTTKTCMVVGEVYPDARATIIGIGVVPSAGIRKGEIIDQGMALQCVTDAWQLAQDHANVDICSVMLAVTGEHMKGESREGSCRLADRECCITDAHIQAARFDATKNRVAADRVVINRDMGSFLIDGNDAGLHPVGMEGRTLTLPCHEMHGLSTRLQNSLHCVRQVPLEVDSVVFSPFATAQAILTRKQKEEGALLIDIGGGTTDYICYLEGEIIASGCIPVGGNSINQDIIHVANSRINFRTAEALKCLYGNAFHNMRDTSLLRYQDGNGLHAVSIECGVLNRIIFDRLSETLDMVRSRIPKEVMDYRGLNVYLSGGTSLMAGLDKLAHYVLGRVIYQPSPPPSGDEYSFKDDPRYCTAFGLIRYAQFYEEVSTAKPQGSFLSRLGSMFSRKS